ncbi:RidA family protein [Allosphingosinicella deserti]|uniref:RidA family protein n=1 Tax=Allosphingosinicella deserti TaxID=2116704 RepID=UPI0013048CD3|nr:RidA family protein [Sphingomonas deserti]
MVAIAGAALLGAVVVSATAAGQSVEKADPPGVAKPLGGYSHVASVPPGARMLYVAGQIGNRPDGTLPDSVEDQIVQAYENVRIILASQGARPDHIVKVTVYAVARPTDMARLRAHRAMMFKGMAPPPSTWVYVSGLARPEHLVEVEAIAAVPVR